MSLLDAALVALQLRDVAAHAHPEVDQPSCQLLGTTGLVVQGLLGVFVILSLVFKRHRESPKRPWRIWLFDVSKQVVGQMFIHGANVLVSSLASRQPDTENACVSYFLHILIDTTFGVAIIYFTLHTLTRFVTETLKWEGFQSGVYGNPPSVIYWLRQAAIYVLTLSFMKLIVIALLMAFPGIYDLGEWLLSWTNVGEGHNLQLIFVMGIFPITMNIVQFWLIDSIVKASGGGHPALDIESGPGPHEEDPLFNAPFDDDDDRPHPANPRPADSSRSMTSIDSAHEFPASRDDKSVNTGLTTPDEHKTTPEPIPAGSSSRQPAENHNYPPSLSSSVSSAASSAHHEIKAPRAATNLMKKIQKRDLGASSPRSPHTPFQSPQSSRIPPPAVAFVEPARGLASAAVIDDDLDAQLAEIDSWNTPDWTFEPDPQPSKHHTTDGLWTPTTAPPAYTGS